MSSTTTGFAKVHTTTGKSTLDKGWLDSLNKGCSTLKETFKSGKTLTYDWRLSQLKAIETMLVNEKERIAGALAADLNRPDFEVEVYEIASTLAEVRFAISNLRSWMKPESALTPPVLQMGSSRIERIPKGVVFVMGAWNFPFHLSLTPCIAAIAAGNCVVLKPSDVSPASAQQLKELCEKYMDPSAFMTFLGGVEESTELLARKWNHIFYTGNAVIGRVVMTAAAKHLCPVTLELGGKSPVIVDCGLSASQLATAANRIVSTACFVNAGQICVSPDYVLVHQDAEKALLEALKKAVTEMTQSKEKTSKVVNSRHFARLKNLAETSEGEVLCGGTKEGTGADAGSCFLPPTIISRPKLTSPSMSEELFGPLLMITPVASLDEACAYVNNGEVPLALYVFSNSSRRAEEVISKTRSGGALINDTTLHLVNPYVPFGGCGESGFGAYHGKWGFEEFSHKRTVIARPLFLDVDRYPPYTSFKQSLVRTVMLMPDFVKHYAAKFMWICGY